LDSNIRRILIVRTDRIGDVILTLPMARALKKNSPSVRISLLIQRYTSEIVESDPAVDQIIHYDDGNRGLPFLDLVTSLRRERFDVVFHTHPRFRVALMTWLARIPVRVGTGYRWYSFLFNRKVFEHRKDAKKHELEYNLSLLSSVGLNAGGNGIAPTLEVKPETLDSVRGFLSRLGVRENERIVIIHPGSGGSARDWNAKNFGLLGRRMRMLPGIRVIVTGGESEEILAKHVRDLSGDGTLVVIDRLNLQEYAALAKLASLFIANSTGPLHIAAGVGTPVIGLYPQIASLSATRWGPYTEKKKIFSPVGMPADCTKCLSSKTDACECMDSISVDQVFEAARAYLSAD
jgi:lipopolysaccharide heptosyltransferase II